MTTTTNASAPVVAPKAPKAPKVTTKAAKVTKAPQAPAKAPRVPVTLPKGVTKAHVSDLPEAFLTDLKAAAAPGNLKATGLARVMQAHGLYPQGATEGRYGLALRSYMRSHGAWVGKGKAYGMTFAEARTEAAGFVGKVTPPKGVRYAQGRKVDPKAPKADTPAPDAA